MPDSETYLDFKAFRARGAARGREGGEVTYLSSWGGTGSPSTGIETTKLTDLTGETAQEIKSGYCAAMSPGESWINITTTDKDGGQQVYRIRVLRDRSVQNVTLYREKVTADNSQNFLLLWHRKVRIRSKDARMLRGRVRNARDGVYDVWDRQHGVL